MSFSRNFLSYFNDEEKNSQIVQIYATQGDNADMALMQEAEKLIQQGTEMLKFPEPLLRSWLAALLQQVRNLTSASGTLKITNIGTGPVNLEKGALFTTDIGVLYTQTSEDVLIAEGMSAVVNIRQGESSEATGYYHEYAKVAADDLDIDQLEVYISGHKIKPCEVQNNNVVPINGYFAFCHSGYLFVKVFPGEDTPYPEGSYYRIVAWHSSGKYGNISKDAITGHVDRVYQTNGIEATLLYSNPAILGGLAAPTRADLVNQLRYWFFVKDSVSSVPEYIIWMRDQPEVGDAIVEGDYEKYLQDPQGFQFITGQVYIAGLDRDGHPLTPETQLELVKRLSPLKDIAMIKWEQPLETRCYISVKFRSSSDNASFIDLVSNVIRNYFSMSWLREQGFSLFDDLDFEKFRNSIGTTYSQVGMEIIPYHVAEFTVYEDDGAVNGDMPYVGESGNGRIEIWRDDVLFTTWVQEKLPTGEINIYNPGEPDSPIVGYVADGIFHISYPSGLLAGDIVRCYWSIQDPGVLPIGQNYGYRTLFGFSIDQVLEG